MCFFKWRDFYCLDSISKYHAHICRLLVADYFIIFCFVFIKRLIYHTVFIKAILFGPVGVEMVIFTKDDAICIILKFFFRPKF